MWNNYNRYNSLFMYWIRRLTSLNPSNKDFFYHSVCGCFCFFFFFFFSVYWRLATSLWYITATDWTLECGTSDCVGKRRHVVLPSLVPVERNSSEDCISYNEVVHVSQFEHFIFEFLPILYNMWLSQMTRRHFISNYYMSCSRFVEQPGIRFIFTFVLVKKVLTSCHTF